METNTAIRTNTEYWLKRSENRRKNLLPFQMISEGRDFHHREEPLQSQPEVVLLQLADLFITDLQMRFPGGVQALGAAAEKAGGRDFRRAGDQ